jgi:hypothetical protein
MLATVSVLQGISFETVYESLNYWMPHFRKYSRKKLSVTLFETHTTVHLKLFPKPCK